MRPKDYIGLAILIFLIPSILTDVLYYVRPTVKEFIKEEFEDIPIMVKIAFCESSFRQEDKDGSILRGKVDENDIGVYQINQKYHKDRAEKLGMNIYTLSGNMAFARFLYSKYGTKPWLASSNCWKDKGLTYLNI